MSASLVLLLAFSCKVSSTKDGAKSVNPHTFAMYHGVGTPMVKNASQVIHVSLAESGSLPHQAAAARSKGMIVLSTSIVKLRKVTDITPWEGAMPCLEESKDGCTCGNWVRWAGEGMSGMAPIPCVRNTLAATYALAQFVYSKGYTAVLKGGTLLGAMRCGSFVPWDYDADLQIYVQSNEAKRKLQAEIDTWAGGKDRPSSSWVTIFGDLGDWTPNGESTNHGNTHLDVKIDVASRSATPEAVPCVLNDVIMHCPKEYDGYLQEHYGADWKTSPRRWKAWAEGQLDSAPIQTDVASTEACPNRMQEIAKQLEGVGF